MTVPREIHHSAAEHDTSREQNACLKNSAEQGVECFICRRRIVLILH
jgi:hypothetical protein